MGFINAKEIGLTKSDARRNAELLQGAIDRLANDGGGILRFPAGRYLIGGLELRSNITLQIDGGGHLLGSPRLDDYRYWKIPPVRFSEDDEGLRALLYAHGCKNVTIEGNGTIDGQGPKFQAYKKVRAGRPRVIWFAECQRVLVRDVTLKNSAFWMQHYLKCSDLRLHRLNVWNHGSTNNDGCDIDCCRDVIVSDCRIDSYDDAICLKSGNDAPTQNVLISNCITATHCNHLKTGTESNGGFKNIVAENLLMIPSRSRNRHNGTEGADYRGACGIALGCVDGGNLENVTISNVRMEETRVPFFIRLGHRGTPIHGSNHRQPPGRANGIRLSNIHGTELGRNGGYIMGIPGCPVEDVSLDTCTFLYEAAPAGMGDPETLVPLSINAYPSCDAFGCLPAYGLFIRHAHRVALSNLRFTLQGHESRPALTWRNVEDISLLNMAEKLQGNMPRPSASISQSRK